MPVPGWESTRDERAVTSYQVVLGEAELGAALSCPTEIPGLAAGAGGNRSFGRRG